MINHIEKLTLKHKDKDVTWLLKKIKKVSTGIDSLGNKPVNYFNTVKYFFHRRQGPLEGYQGYKKRARLVIETLILYVGHHILFGTDIMEVVDQENQSDK